MFTRGEKNERDVIHPVRAPDSFALGFVIERVYKRLVKWLRRHDLLAQYNHERTESTDPSAMDACVKTSLSQTGLMRLDDQGLTEPQKPDTADDAVTASRCAKRPPQWSRVLGLRCPSHRPARRSKGRRSRLPAGIARRTSLVPPHRSAPRKRCSMRRVFSLRRSALPSSLASPATPREPGGSTGPRLLKRVSDVEVKMSSPEQAGPPEYVANLELNVTAGP